MVHEYDMGAFGFSDAQALIYVFNTLFEVLLARINNSLRVCWGLSQAYGGA